MNDFEKYKKVFDETNITYSCLQYNPKGKDSVIELSVHQECLNKETCGAGLELLFHVETGSLIRISPWGE